MASFSWGVEDRRSAYIGPYGGTQWISSAGIPGFPAGNLNRDGNRLVYLADIQPTYASGPSYWRGRIYINGGVYYSGQIVQNPASSFNFDVEYSGGQLNYGRDVGGGYGITSSNAGTQWSGDLLTGYIAWATVPYSPPWVSASSVPGGKALVQWGAPGWNGDSGIQNHLIQWATNSSFTAGFGEVATNTDTYSWTVNGLTPGTTYYFRVATANGVGWSQFSGTTSAQLRSGGQRWTGSAWVPQRVRRWNGSAWLDQRVRRWNGSAWVDER